MQCFIFEHRDVVVDVLDYSPRRDRFFARCRRYVDRSARYRDGRRSIALPINYRCEYRRLSATVARSALHGTSAESHTAATTTARRFGRLDHTVRRRQAVDVPVRLSRGLPCMRRAHFGGPNSFSRETRENVPDDLIRCDPIVGSSAAARRRPIT